MSSSIFTSIKSIDEDFVLVTTIKNALQFLWITITFAIIFSGDLHAAPKTPLQRGIEAKEAGKWKQAKTIFESIGPDDADHGLALDELADVAQRQEAEREARSSRYVAERLVEKLDKGAEKCLKLIKEDGSPEVHNCVQEMSSLQTEVSAKLQSSSYENPTLKEVVTLIEPFKKFDAVALPVTNVRPSRDDIRQASDRVMALESYIQDSNNPPTLIALGAFVLSQFHLGAAKAHAIDCERARNGKNRDEEVIRAICGDAEREAKRYADIFKSIDSTSLIEGKSIPSITYQAVAPIEVSDLPKPEVVATRIAPKEEINENAAPPKKKKKKRPVASESSFGNSIWTSPFVVYGVPVGVAVATGMHWMMKTPAQVNEAQRLAQVWRMNRTEETLSAVVNFAKLFGITVSVSGAGDKKVLSASVASVIAGVSPSLAAQIMQAINAVR